MTGEGSRESKLHQNLTWTLNSLKIRGKCLTTINRRLGLWKEKKEHKCNNKHRDTKTQQNPNQVIFNKVHNIKQSTENVTFLELRCFINTSWNPQGKSSKNIFLWKINRIICYTLCKNDAKILTWLFWKKHTLHIFNIMLLFYKECEMCVLNMIQMVK